MNENNKPHNGSLDRDVSEFIDTILREDEKRKKREEEERLQQEAALAALDHIMMNGISYSPAQASAMSPSQASWSELVDVTLHKHDRTQANECERNVQARRACTDWTALVKRSIELNDAAYMEKERAALGTFRAGSTGVIALDGRQIGEPILHSYLRMKGIDIQQTPLHRKIMMAGGVANESVWEHWLSFHFKPEQIRREEEIPVVWQTSAGDYVTGRPDIVIVDEDTGLPLEGLECKMACTMWTAKGVNMPPQEPKSSHLMQAAHYAWQLGLMAGQASLPYSIVYTSYVEYALEAKGIWQKWFPKPGELGSEGMAFDKRYPIMVPFVNAFHLTFEGDGDDAPLMWKGPYNDRPVSTKHITRGGIKRYFEKLSQMKASPESFVLGEEGDGLKDNVVPMPSTVDAKGNKAGYSVAEYCPLPDLCCASPLKGMSLRELEDRILLTPGVTVLAPLDENVQIKEK